AGFFSWILLFCLLEKQATFVSSIPCNRRGRTCNRKDLSRLNHESKCTGKIVVCQWLCKNSIYGWLLDTAGMMSFLSCRLRIHKENQNLIRLRRKIRSKENKNPDESISLTIKRLSRIVS